MTGINLLAPRLAPQQAQSQPQPHDDSLMHWCWADAASYITGTEIVIDGGNLQTI